MENLDAQSLRHLIISFLAEKINISPHEINQDLDLFEQAGLDSLAFLELLGHIEKETGIEIDLGDLSPEDFSTINRLVEIVLQMA